MSTTRKPIDFDTLTSDQQRRFGEVVDSRVRLLGEDYGKAVQAVAADGAGNYDWIMAVTS